MHRNVGGRDDARVTAKPVLRSRREPNAGADARDEGGGSSARPNQVVVELEPFDPTRVIETEAERRSAACAPQGESCPVRLYETEFTNLALSDSIVHGGHQVLGLSHR